MAFDEKCHIERYELPWVGRGRGIFTYPGEHLVSTYSIIPPTDQEGGRACTEMADI